MDECSVDNGGCEGLCANRQGSYQCSCSEGFRLASNGKKCIGKNCPGCPCLLSAPWAHLSVVVTWPPICNDRSQRMSFEEWTRSVSGQLSQHARLVRMRLRGAARHPIGQWRPFVRGSRWMPPIGRQFRLLSHLSQYTGHCILYLPRRLHVGRRLEDLSRYNQLNSSIHCTWIEFWTLKCQLLDIDECELEDVGQSCAGSCINTIGSFKCSEEEEEEEEEIEEEETTTTSTTTPPPPSQIEDEEEEEEEIECPQGFLPNEDEGNNEANCVDVDECSLPGDQHNFGCSHQCVNTQGSAHCDCPQGYVIGEDKKTCQDVDECATKEKFGCEDECVNTVGSAHCQCRHSGYQLAANDSKSCVDRDECLQGDNFGCSHQCVNLAGSAECRCHSGYKLKSDQKSCKDIDECAKDNGGCSHQCDNLKGSMKCSCPEGYQLSTENDKLCVEMDECGDAETLLKCTSSGGSCVNTPGSYKCDCPEGYVTNSSASSDHCIDVDECADAETPPPCSNGWTNLPGSYRCQCDAGFVSDENGTCADIDECPQGVCDQLCTNLPGSYVCDCHSGYQLIGDRCQDVDECGSQSAPPCDGICRNTMGSFECFCADGFRLTDDNKCQDVDECGEDPCLAASAICTNSPGSYSCSCQMGYQMADNNGTCVGIIWNI